MTSNAQDARCSGRTFSFHTELPAGAEEVWTHATSMQGVNRELFPLARMTFPADRARLRAEDLRLGQRAFRSWILAFGVLPVDYDDVTFVEFDPPRRFLERSTMLTQKVWLHERRVEPVGDGCVLRDDVTFEPRLPWLAAAQGWLFRLVFANRHRRLRRLFGAGGRPEPPAN